jgi:hypothetical protein
LRVTPTAGVDRLAEDLGWHHTGCERASAAWADQ